MLETLKTLLLVTLVSFFVMFCLILWLLFSGTITTDDIFLATRTIHTVIHNDKKQMKEKLSRWLDRQQKQKKPEQAKPTPTPTATPTIQPTPEPIVEPTTTPTPQAQLEQPQAEATPAPSYLTQQEPQIEQLQLQLPPPPPVATPQLLEKCVIDSDELAIALNKYVKTKVDAEMDFVNIIVKMDGVCKKCTKHEKKTILQLKMMAAFRAGKQQTAQKYLKELDKYVD